MLRQNELMFENLPIKEICFPDLALYNNFTIQVQTKNIQVLLNGRFERLPLWTRHKR